MYFLEELLNLQTDPIVNVRHELSITLVRVYNKNNQLIYNNDKFNKVIRSLKRDSCIEIVETLD